MTIKYYAHMFNVLSNGEQFTRAVYRYQLFLGDMKEGDFLCVDLEKHDNVQQFTTEQIMREHWHTCHGIPVEEIMLPMVVPVLIREPARPTPRELGLGSGSATLDLVAHQVVSLVQAVVPGRYQTQNRVPVQREVCL